MQWVCNPYLLFFYQRIVFMYSESSHPSVHNTILGQSTKLGDRYIIHRLQGIGGTADVYLGRDNRLNADVAIKVLRTTLLHEADDPRPYVESFKREAQTLARLRGHPHIVAVYDHDEVDEYVFFVMEYLRGTNLRDRLKKLHDSNQCLGWPEVGTIMQALCAALSHAHENKVIHRDIKPANVMFRTNNPMTPPVPVVTDFGISKVIESLPQAQALDQTQTLTGTPLYMSPEQAEGQAVDERSDLYSLGIVLYEMVTGVRPFDDTSVSRLLDRHKNDKPRAPRELRHDIPPMLEMVMLKAIEKIPGRRYQTAEEMLQAFNEAMQEAVRQPLEPRVSRISSTPSSPVLQTGNFRVMTPNRQEPFEVELSMVVPTRELVAQLMTRLDDLPRVHHSQMINYGLHLEIRKAVDPRPLNTSMSLNDLYIEPGATLHLRDMPVAVDNRAVAVLWSEDGLHFDLLPQPYVTIGRRHRDVIPDIDLKALDPNNTVSRQHFQLLYRASINAWQIHVLSAYGLKLNGKQLRQHERHPLKNGDHLVLGDVALHFETKSF